MKEINLEGAASYDYFAGVILEKKGDLSGAVLAYQRSLAKNDDSLVTLFRLANLYTQLGDFEPAMETYGRVVLSKDPDQGGVKTKAAEQQERIRRMLFPQLDGLRNRVNSNQADSKARAELAIQLDRIGYYDEALDHYLKLAESDAANWQLFFNIANIYKKMNRLKEAATYYEKSLAANPGYPDTLNNLGVVYKGLQQYPRAVVFFEKAIAADPHYAFAPFNLATTYVLMGQKENALKYFRYTREHFPELEIKVKDYLKTLEGK
jgi:tetratricopeptide (TPR) repeat protein